MLPKLASPTKPVDDFSEKSNEIPQSFEIGVLQVELPANSLRNDTTCGIVFGEEQ